MMNNLQREAWYIGNLVGVPIFLHWSALILVLMVVGGSAGGGVTSILMVLIVLILGIVLHELGHGLTARLFGAHGITITLWAFGGLCSSRRDNSRLGREMVIVAAGPAVSLGLWLGSYAALRLLAEHAPDSVLNPAGLTLFGLFLAESARINLALFIFNMLPIFPMDGGQLVYYGAIATTRNQLLARQISLFLAVIGSLAFFAFQTGLFGMMQDGGSTAQWIGTLGLNDLLLAILLGFMLRSAFSYLY